MMQKCNKTLFIFQISAKYSHLRAGQCEPHGGEGPETLQDNLSSEGARIPVLQQATNFIAAPTAVNRK